MSAKGRPERGRSIGHAGDTIAAVATPAGRGGVGIVRVSGPRVKDVMQAVIARTLVPRMATLSTFLGGGSEMLDQGIALYFPAPHSYTGEEVLELHGHGGPAVLALVLERCVQAGARLADPGEFTQRAFLNGKLDLAQAEAVADLIEAGSATAVRAAARSLSGEFSREVHAIADAVLELRTLTEASLDFPDEDIDFVRAADAQGRLQRIATQLARLRERARRGSLLREGLTLVLIGRPNVGKSSLMNRLAAEDVAIVTEIAGTTRDALRSHVEIGGIPVTVIDTAGLRATDDPIETIGIDRTWSAVAQADVALVIRDARSSTPDAADDDILARVPAALARVIVHNKIDLTGAAPRREHATEGVWHLFLSAKTGAGLDLLEHTILELAGAVEDHETAFLARARHLEALAQAARHVDDALGQLAGPSPALELMAESLRQGHDALGEIVGVTTAEDLLGAIFSRFCIGK